MITLNDCVLPLNIHKRSACKGFVNVNNCILFKMSRLCKLLVLISFIYKKNKIESKLKITDPHKTQSNSEFCC